MQSGSNDRGGWSRQEIVVEIPGQYPRSVCISLWGDRINDAVKYNEGDMLKISFDLQSREYNGRWFTDVRAWRIEREGAETPAGAAAETSATQAAADDPFSTSKQVDDLPF